jgi:hypothetical protein
MNLRAVRFGGQRDREKICLLKIRTPQDKPDPAILLCPRMKKSLN